MFIQKDIDITILVNVSKTGKAFLPEFHETDPNKRKWLSCDSKPDMLNRAVVTMRYAKE